MVIKALTLALACTLIISVLLPVTASAAENPGGWIELMEYSSIHSNGENWFTINGKTGGFTLPLYGEKRLCKIDMLIWHQYAERITKATVIAGSATTTLSSVHVGNGLTRIFGAIPNAYYEFINVQLEHSTSSAVTFELLSCRVTPVQTTDIRATGTLRVDDNLANLINCPGNYLVEGGGADLTIAWQTPIEVTDWQKFDTVTVFGSLSGIGLNSVRCSIGAKGIPYEISYTSTNPTGTSETYTETVSISHYDTTDRYYGEIRGTHDTNFSYQGKVLFTITVDLSGVDRSSSWPLVIYFTGVTYDGYSHAFNCQDLSGSIVTPDTSGVTWWARFTAFMTDLMGGDSSQADQFADQMEEQSQQMQDAVDQMDEVTRPPVSDIEVSIDGYVDAEGMDAVGGIVDGFLGNPLVMAMVMISLIVSLAAYVIFGKH